MIHELKIWTVYFERLLDGSKTFEYRKNDRGFQRGDVVVLKEFDPNKRIVVDAHPLLESDEIVGVYTHRERNFKIGFIFQIPNSEYCILSLLKLEEVQNE